MSSIFEYIALSDPRKAASVVNRFGYKFTTDRMNPKQLGALLRDLVAKEGQPAMLALLEIHPDKDVILEQFSSSGCGCNGEKDCKCSSSGNKMMNATGPADPVMQSAVINSNSNAVMASADANKLAAMNNGLIIAAALLISTLIFLNKK